MADPDSDPELPNDMLEEIFTCMDPEQLGQLKTTNKDLNVMISSNNFMKKHLLKMKELNRGVFVLQPEFCFVPLFYDDLEDHVQTNGRLVTNDDKSTEVVASSNGLILFCNLADEFFLLNPSTKKRHQLPTQKVTFPIGCSWAQVFFGMGYLPNEDDYKIVRIALFNSTTLKTEVMMYSRNSGVWIRCPDFPHDFPMAQPGACVHGRLHWRSAIFSNNYSITSLNLLNGEYGTLLIPDVPLMFGVQQVVALNDETLALSCSVLFLGSPYVIWILKDYFDNTSWTKFQINVSLVLWSENIINLQPLSLVKSTSSKLIFRLDPVGLFGIFEMNTEEFFIMDAEEIEEGYCTIYGFVPSLHSPSPA